MNLGAPVQESPPPRQGAESGFALDTARVGQVLAHVPEESLAAADRADAIAPPTRLDVRRPAAGERERDTVQRQRVFAPDGFQPRQARPALDHVVLGMDLEPQAGPAAGQSLAEVLGLEPEAG